MVTKLKTTFCSHTSSQVQLHPFVLDSPTFFPTLRGTGRMGKWGLWMVHKSSFLLSFFLTLFPCPSVGTLPGVTVLHKLLQLGYPSPWSTVLEEQIAPAWVPHAPQLLPGNLILCGLLSSGCSTYVGSLWAAASFRAFPPAVARGPPWPAVWICSPTWSSMGGRGPSAPAPGAPLSALSSLTLVTAGSFFIHLFFSFLSLIDVGQHFLPFLQYVFTEAPPPHWWAQVWPMVGLICNQMDLPVSGTGQPHVSSTHAAPPLPKPCLMKPVQCAHTVDSFNLPSTQTPSCCGAALQCGLWISLLYFYILLSLVISINFFGCKLYSKVLYILLI